MIRPSRGRDAPSPALRSVRLTHPERVLFPEYLTCEDKSAQIAGHIVKWLKDADLREGVVAELAKLKARVGHGGASRMAAEYIVNAVENKSIPVPRPHFVPGMRVASSGGGESI